MKVLIIIVCILALAALIFLIKRGIIRFNKQIERIFEDSFKGDDYTGK